jgi:hypothetical protein
LEFGPTPSPKCYIVPKEVHFNGIVIGNVKSSKEGKIVKSKFRVDRKGARLQLEQVSNARPQSKLRTMLTSMAKTLGTLCS